jgi:hypothetical protein
MKLADIPKFMTDGYYRVNQSWDALEDWITSHQNIGHGMADLDLDPDFQRGHVWTPEQQISFVEFMLQGGKGSNEIRFNCVGWMRSMQGPFVLVDGKQRIEAARKFMRHDLGVFASKEKPEGYNLCDFEDAEKLGWGIDFVMMINNLPTRKAVLQWYLEINSGGVVHTKQELDKVRHLLSEEKMP